VKERPNERLEKRKSVLFGMLVLWLVSFSPICWAQGNEKVLDLEEAYRLAMKTQESIAIGRTEVEKGRLQPKKAWTIMTPRMSITGLYTRLNEPIEYTAQLGSLTLPPIQTFPEDQAVGNFEFLQPIYEGEFFPARRKAGQALDLSIENFYQTAQDVLFQVAQAYYEVLKDERLVQNAKETVDLSQEELRLSQVKFKAGAVTEDAVLMAELNLTRAQSKVTQNLNSLSLAREVLKSLVGWEDQSFNLVEPKKLEGESAKYDEEFQKALDNRYDYKMTSLKVKMAESDVDLVKAKFHPKLEGSWDYYKVSDPGWLQADNYWVALIKLKIPLFEGGQRYLDLEEKTKSLQQAKLALEDLRKNIQLDVKGAMLKMLNEKALLANATKQVELAQKNYEIVFNKYQFGATTFSELNEAHVYREMAKTDFIVHTFDYQTSILNMQRSTGLFATAYIQKKGELGEEG
jgi:outer membrane protein